MIKKLYETYKVKKLVKEAVEIADRYYDGHMSLMKFTTNWRFGFKTPINLHRECHVFVQGKTKREALENGITWHRSGCSVTMWKYSDELELTKLERELAHGKRKKKTVLDDWM